MMKVAQVGSALFLDEGNSRTRNTRDGTAIKLDANSRVYTMDMWICLDETVPVFSWRAKLVRPVKIV